MQNSIAISKKLQRYRSFLTFCRFGWKTPIKAPFCFFGDLTPKWGAISTRPQTARHWTERRHVTYKPSKSVQRCDRWTRERNKKHTERKKPDSGKLAIRPDHPRCHSAMDLYVSSYPGSSYIFQVSSKSAQGFRSHGVSKFALDLVSDYVAYCSLYYSTKP